MAAGRWHCGLVGRATAEREQVGPACHSGAGQLRGRRDGRDRTRHLRPDRAGRVQPRWCRPARTDAARRSYVRLLSSAGEYGDNIPEQPSTNPGQEQWRVFRATARLWRDAVNTHGGDVTLVELPAVGIRGNTHFPMSDLNNVQIADLLSKFLADKRLD
jgi:hypothetical protein